MDVEGLFIIGFVCLFIGYQGQLQDNPPLATTIWAGIRKTIGMVGWAALLAGGLAYLFPLIAQGDLANENLAGLNAAVAAASTVLKYAWVVVALACLAALGFIVVTRQTIAEGRAKAAGQAIKAVGIAKGAFAILAASSFVGSTWVASADQTKAAADQARQDLTSLRLALFEKAQTTFVGLALSEAMDSSADNAPAVAQVREAYTLVAAPPNDAIALPMESQRPARATKADSLPDLRPAEIQEAELRLDTLIASPDKAIDPFAKNLAAILVEKPGADQIKAALLDFGNPVINALVGNVIDPLVVDPLKARLSKAIAGFVAGRLQPAAVLELARTAGRAAAPRLASGVAGAAIPTGSQVALGDGEWDAVRKGLAAGVERGLLGKSAEVQDDARRMMQTAQRELGAIQVLYHGSTKARLQQEAAFGRYLLRRPDYAALWGYAVISIPPPRYAAELERISLAGGIKRKAALMVEAAQAAVGGDADARQVIAEFGLDPNEVARWSEREAISNWSRIHEGAYPRDGFETYFAMSAPNLRERAMTYYLDDRVGTFVSKYCPVA